MSRMNLRRRRRLIVVKLTLCVLVAIALTVLLLIGYVPADGYGKPPHERLWVVLFGIGEGLLVGLVLDLFWGSS